MALHLSTVSRVTIESLPMFGDAAAFCIDEEMACDIAMRETLLNDAFGPARFLKTCEKLRRTQMPALALTARTPGSGATSASLIGTVRLWPIFAGFGRASLLLGPLAVVQGWRDYGVGAALMRDAIARVKALGYGSILLVGDATYYRRFGFEQRHTAGLILPGPVDESRFLGLELRKGALAGAQGDVRAAGDLIALSQRASCRLLSDRKNVNREPSGFDNARLANEQWAA